MTYYYLRLYSRDVRPLFFGDTLKGIRDLQRYDRRNNVLDEVIRTESLEEDLLRALRKAGFELTEDQTARVRDARRAKVNASKHQTTSHYYDRECADLVGSRDAFLIEKYNYREPDLFD